LADYHVHPVEFAAEGEVSIRSRLQEPAFVDADAHRRAAFLPKLGRYRSIPGIEPIVTAPIVDGSRDFSVAQGKQFLARCIADAVVIGRETVDYGSPHTPACIMRATVARLVTGHEVK